CREVLPPSSCCRGIPPVPGEWCCARRHRGFAHPFVAEQCARFVAARWVIEFQRAALLRSPSPAGPEPPRIQSRFAIRERFPARRNRVAFEKLLARCPVRSFSIAEQTALEMKRSGAGCPACDPGAGALRFEKCLAGSTNQSADGSRKAPGQQGNWLKRSPGSRPSLFACFQEAGTHAPATRAKSASANPPACPIFRP